MNNIDPNKLWENFLDTFTNHFMDFNGRIGRTQFWYYMLVAVGISFVAGILGRTIPLISTVVSLALLLPNLGMIVRRLHDTGKPGIWAALLAVPFALSLLIGLLLVLGSLFSFLFFLLALTGLITLLTLTGVVVLIYFCAQPGETQANQYGPVPPDWVPSK